MSEDDNNFFFEGVECVPIRRPASGAHALPPAAAAAAAARAVASPTRPCLAARAQKGARD
jgi:hypothetical protein